MTTWTLLRSALTLGVMLTVLCTIQPAQAETLISPFKLATPPTANPKGEIYTCGGIPPAHTTVQIEELFDQIDPTMSVITPKKQTAYDEDIAPINEFLEGLARMANTYTRSNGRNLSSAQCALEWLHSWAAVGAMTGDATNQGNFVRKWALSSIASSYLQISVDGRLDAKKRIEVKKWIQQLSKIIIANYSKQTDISRRNHRLYWAALAVGISSVAIQDKTLYDWAMDKAKIGLIQVEADGTLPLEVRRGERSQTFHIFAAEPLVLLAELALRNGDDLYGYNNGALHRLAERNISNLIDPSYLAHRSGTKQKINMKTFPEIISWLEPYYRRFGFTDPKLAKKSDDILREHRPLFDRRIGGDATLLFQHIEMPKPVPGQPASAN